MLSENYLLGILEKVIKNKGINFTTSEIMFPKKAENVNDHVKLLYPVLTKSLVFNKYFFLTVLLKD